jgi:hypothetical protein
VGVGLADARARLDTAAVSPPCVRWPGSQRYGVWSIQGHSSNVIRSRLSKFEESCAPNRHDARAPCALKTRTPRACVDSRSLTGDNMSVRKAAQPAVKASGPGAVEPGAAPPPAGAHSYSAKPAARWTLRPKLRPGARRQGIANGGHTCSAAGTQRARLACACARALDCLARAPSRLACVSMHHRALPAARAQTRPLAARPPRARRARRPPGRPTRRSVLGWTAAFLRRPLAPWPPPPPAPTVAPGRRRRAPGCGASSPA